MEHTNPTDRASKLSTETIILSIRQVRDNLISELLTDDVSLSSYLEEHFGPPALSKLKLEFLKRDLMELKHSPLDLSHYSSLIKQLKESGAMASGKHALHEEELITIFQKYGVPAS